MNSIILKKPSYEELVFRQKLIGDEKTMAYNHAYGGTISFPREKWTDWFGRWITDESGERFYRYLYSEEQKEYVGEVSYHYEEGKYICDVIVSARHRGNGYGRQGLLLLCESARENGVEELYDMIAIDNPSVELFKKLEFVELLRNDEYVLVKKKLV